MIVVELSGGVGNQLFQYAAARALADRLDTDLGLDLRPYRAKDSRRYGLDAFHIRATVVPDEDLLGVHGPRTLRRELTTGLLDRLVTLGHRPRLAHLTRVVHQGPSFTEVLTTVTDNSWLSGYWQSERYFADDADRIRADLRLKNVSAESAALEQTIRAMDYPVAAHVRRGDYATVESTRLYHGLQGWEYYRAAIRQIRERRPEAQFVFFSDEPEWVAANLGPDIAVLVRANGTDRPQEDLHLMSCCRGHIIANSSFSWWGAWLAQSELVIAPAKWYQAAGLDERDVVPARWMRV